MKNILIAVLWIVLAWVNSGFLHANWVYKARGIYNKSKCIEDQGIELGLDLLLMPVVIVVTPFVTGFYQHGWKWSCTDAPRLDSYGFED